MTAPTRKHRGGRPSFGVTEAVVTFRAPRELVAAVRQLAKIRGITASEAWRRAAQTWLGVKPHPYTVHLGEKER